MFLKTEEKIMTTYKGYAVGRESCMGRLVFLSGIANTRFLKETEDGRGPVILIIDENIYIRPGDFDIPKLSGIVINNPDILESSGSFAARIAVPLLFVCEEIDPAFERETAIIDPKENSLYISPDFEMINKFTIEMKEKTERERRLLEICRRPSVTLSGRKIELFEDCRRGEEQNETQSEFGGMYIKCSSNGNYPDKEEGLFVFLRNIYEKTPDALFLVCIHKPLGIGFAAERAEDKQKDREAFFYRENETDFRKEIRAVCRAAVFARTKIIFSGIFTDNDTIACRRILAEELAGLGESGAEFGHITGVGMLIDCPAAAIMSDKIADDTDFFCIDADMLAGNIFGCFNPYSLLFSGDADYTLPVFRMINKILATAQDKPVFVRGNFLSEKNNTVRLLESGISGFISHGGNLLKIKEKVLEAE